MNQEIIGLDLAVTKSNNKNLIGITGRIINETKNTITITMNNAQKTIIKNNNTFLIGGKVVNGSDINRRSEDRIKK
jgi:ribonuclease P protein subunit POP4